MTKNRLLKFIAYAIPYMTLTMYVAYLCVALVEVITQNEILFWGLFITLIAVIDFVLFQPIRKLIVDQLLKQEASP